MKKRIALVYVLVFLTSMLSAQETKVYFGFGGIYHSFQDARFSDVQFNKSSFKPELGFSRISENDYWFANASAHYFINEHPATDTIETSTFGYNVRVGYLQAIKPEFYLGATWDIIDRHRRTNNFLANNADFVKTSSDVFLSGKYIHDLSNDWGLEAGLDYGLLSFVNTMPSFAANYPQHIIDNGEVTFIDSESRNPNSIKLMEAQAFWNHFLLKTHIELKYKRRFSLVYNWDMRSYADNKDYPVTFAMHSLMLRFHFISHSK